MGPTSLLVIYSTRIWPVSRRRIQEEFLEGQMRLEPACRLSESRSGEPARMARFYWTRVKSSLKENRET